ncbi:MAG: preprotein translocase subunit SecE [Chloroflexi bacterium]|nr:preprotein translocase subunit SecE [Chloroflexota bacterium]
MWVRFLPGLPRVPPPEPRTERRDGTVTTTKKPNVIIRTLRETVAELRKVSWPTRQEATQLTIIVLVVVTAMSAFLGLMDYLFARLVGLVLTLG